MNDPVIFLSSLLRVAGISVFIVAIIPRMYKEIKNYSNGLRFLRWAILTATIIYVGLQLLSMIPLFTNPTEIEIIVNLIKDSLYFQTLTLIQASGVFIIAIIFYLIYTKEYREPYL